MRIVFRCCAFCFFCFFVFSFSFPFVSNSGDYLAFQLLSFVVYWKAEAAATEQSKRKLIEWNSFLPYLFGTRENKERKLYHSFSIQRIGKMPILRSKSCQKQCAMLEICFLKSFWWSERKKQRKLWTMPIQVKRNIYVYVVYEDIQCDNQERWAPEKRRERKSEIKKGLNKNVKIHRSVFSIFRKFAEWMCYVWLCACLYISASIIKSCIFVESDAKSVWNICQSCNSLWHQFRLYFE